MSSALYRTFRNYMRSAQRELRMVVYHPRYITLLTLGVVFSYVFFLTLMSEGQPEKLPIAVVDQDGSFLSRRLCHELSATQGVEVVAVFDNHLQARDAMQRLRIFAFLEIPQGTYNEVLQFRRPTITIYSNNAYLLGGSFSYKSLATMTKLACGAVQREVLRKKGLADDQIMGLIQPVEFDTRMIGNPWSSYKLYLMTTLIPAIIAFVALMHTAFAVCRERRERTLRVWHKKARGNTLSALLGKMLPYTAWYSLLCITANLIMFGPMHFPLEGSWLLMVANSILLVFASQCAACLIACCLPDAPLTMSVCSLYAAMSFSLCGFSFPVDSMPGVFQALAWLYPIRHYFLNYCDIAIYGNGLEHCWLHTATLLAFALALPLGALMLDRQLAPPHPQPKATA